MFVPTMCLCYRSRAASHFLAFVEVFFVFGPTHGALFATMLRVVHSHGENSCAFFLSVATPGRREERRRGRRRRHDCAPTLLYNTSMSIIHGAFFFFFRVLRARARESQENKGRFFLARNYDLVVVDLWIVGSSPLAVGWWTEREARERTNTISKCTGCSSCEDPRILIHQPLRHL